MRQLIIATAETSGDGQCVVLVDEYDKPLLKALNTHGAASFKDFLKPFYGVMKYEERYQRFTFIKGVSKFSKVSIFSDLNNLDDVTLDASIATLFGYTHKEVRENFPQRPCSCRIPGRVGFGGIAAAVSRHGAATG